MGLNAEHMEKYLADGINRLGLNFYEVRTVGFFPGLKVTSQASTTINYLLFIQVSQEGNGLHQNATPAVLVQVRPCRLPVTLVISVAQPGHNSKCLISSPFISSERPSLKISK